MKTRLDLLVKELEETRAAHAEAIIMGNLTYDEYKTQCGVLRGLDLALSEAEALRSQEQDHDD